MMNALPVDLDVTEVLRWQRDALVGEPTGGAWSPKGVADADLAAALGDNLRSNAALWAQEDLARRRDVPDHEIVANKRAIDRWNQARNDAVERIDEALLRLLARRAPPSEVAPLSSETPGSMIDRLGILALKIRAMEGNAVRGDLPPALREACAQRLTVLREQRDDLALCLDRLLNAAAQGRARFKVYRQFKMYNDPLLNPALAAERLRPG